MKIDDKYLNLLHCLIYDKRIKENGMLYSLEIQQGVNCYYISYKAYYNRFQEMSIFVEDFEKGNVVFLIPYECDYMQETLKQLEKIYKEKIKSFFGDKYRDDMIVKISEEERQEQIRWWENKFRGLENWEYKKDMDKEKEVLKNESKKE